MKCPAGGIAVACMACGRVAFAPVGDGNADAGLDDAAVPARLVLHETFETPLAAWQAICGSASTVDGIVTDRAHGGASSARIHYGVLPASSTYCSVAPDLGALGYSAGMPELYVRAWVSIATPMSGATTDVARPLFDLRQDVSGGTLVANWTVAGNGIDGGATNAVSGGLLAYELDRTTVHQQCFFYDAQDAFCIGPGPVGTVTQIDDLRLSYETWHCIETWVRCNSSSGAGDGRWMAWVDGQLKISIDDADGCGPWPTSGLGAYQSLMIGTGADAAGSMIDEFRYWDDYELYDTTGTDLAGVPRITGCR